MNFHRHIFDKHFFFQRKVWISRVVAHGSCVNVINPISLSFLPALLSPLTMCNLVETKILRHLRLTFLVSPWSVDWIGSLEESAPTVHSILTFQLFTLRLPYGY